MNLDLITALVIIATGGILGRFNTWIVDQLKRLQAFSDSSPAVKRAVALVAASLITWISTHLSIALSPDLSQLGLTDVYRIFIGIIAWLSSMVIHNSRTAK